MEHVRLVQQAPVGSAHGLGEQSVPSPWYWPEQFAWVVTEQLSPSQHAPVPGAVKSPSSRMSDIDPVTAQMSSLNGALDAWTTIRTRTWDTVTPVEIPSWAVPLCPPDGEAALGNPGKEVQLDPPFVEYWMLTEFVWQSASSASWFAMPHGTSSRAAVQSFWFDGDSNARQRQESVTTEVVCPTTVHVADVLVLLLHALPPAAGSGQSRAVGRRVSVGN